MGVYKPNPKEKQVKPYPGQKSEAEKMADFCKPFIDQVEQEDRAKRDKEQTKRNISGNGLGRGYGGLPGSRLG